MSFQFQRWNDLVLGLALAPGAGLLSTACGADTAAPTATAPTPTAAPTADRDPPATAAPTPTTAAPAAAETAVPETGDTLGVALDLGAMASGYQVETIPGHAPVAMRLLGLASGTYGHHAAGLSPSAST